MSRYTHTLRGQEAKAIEALPDLSKPSRNAEKQKATGTDGSAYKPAYKKLTKKLYSGLDLSATNGTDPDNRAESVQEKGPVHKPMNSKVLCADSDKMSSADNPKIDNGPGWIRTSEGSRQRVYSPSPLATRAPTQLSAYFTSNEATLQVNLA